MRVCFLYCVYKCVHLRKITVYAVLLLHTLWRWRCAHVNQPHSQGPLLERILRAIFDPHGIVLRVQRSRINIARGGEPGDEAIHQQHSMSMLAALGSRLDLAIFTVSFELSHPQ